MRGPIAQDSHAGVILARAHAIPILTTMAGSAAALVPMIANWPAVPPFGFLMLLAWRLLRPELWAAWIALPLGLFDDLMTGSPIGDAMFLWTVALLLLDALDSRLLWRDYWMDWIVAGCLIIATRAGTVALSGLADIGQAMAVSTVQILLSLLCFPILMRLCLRLDRWRLSR